MDTDSKDIKYRDVVHKVYEQTNICDVVKGFFSMLKRKRENLLILTFPDFLL